MLLYGDVFDVKDEREKNTIIFNTFVFMQLFNEINARRLTDGNLFYIVVVYFILISLQSKIYSKVY